MHAKLLLGCFALLQSGSFLTKSASPSSRVSSAALNIVMVNTRSSLSRRMQARQTTSSAATTTTATLKATLQKQAAGKATAAEKANKTGSAKRKSATTAAAATAALLKKQQQQHASERELLLELPQDDIVVGELRCRPSKRNRSPYVGDVFLPHEQREAVVHLPSLDMGGKCKPGVELLMKPARDNKGNLVGKDAVSPKYGTPKCEFIAQLVRVDESSIVSSVEQDDGGEGPLTKPLYYKPVWVGAHPTLGEKIAEQLIARNLLGADFPAVESFQREVRNVGGMDMRADFVVQHVDKSLPRRVVEVKTVVDTDYAAGAVPEHAKCVYTSDAQPYVRTGIFPWGSVNQKGPNGEAVVSARAIKHVRELTKLAQGKQAKGEEKYDATVLFVVIRGDAKQFRPNHEACPSFAKYLKEAEEAGVQVVAKQVVWGERENMGKCYEGDLLDVVWP